MKKAMAFASFKMKDCEKLGEEALDNKILFDESILL